MSLRVKKPSPSFCRLSFLLFLLLLSFKSPFTLLLLLPYLLHPPPSRFPTFTSLHCLPSSLSSLLLCFSCSIPSSFIFRIMLLQACVFFFFFLSFFSNKELLMELWSLTSTHSSSCSTHKHSQHDWEYACNRKNVIKKISEFYALVILTL